MNLEKLFEVENHICKGCKILQKDGPHTILDYEDKREKEILFVSDSLKMYQGDYVPFRGNEYKLILSELNSLEIETSRVAFTASVKCPNLKQDDMTPNDRKICRQHLVNTIKQYKPKLVFACGKLATTMFYGKNVEDKKSRGKIADFEMDGAKFKLVSIYHPWQVLSEPKNSYLFSLDIRTGIEEIILEVKKKTDFTFIPIFSVEELKEEGKDFLNTKDTISIDIETTGLSFLTDTIHTVALSIWDKDKGFPRKTIAIPVDHREFQDKEFKEQVILFLQEVMGNKENRKILQNCKFDLKFLYRYGVDKVYNVWDSKVMQSFYREEYPRSLADLVQYYFPNQI